MGWYSPLRRGILPLDGLRVSRSLRKMLRRYEIRIDTAFDAVLDGLRRPAAAERLDRPTTSAGSTGGCTSAGSCTRSRPGPPTVSWPAACTG